MGALRLIFRATARRRWRSWLALVVLTSLVGGLVLAAAAAGRRTENAFPNFVQEHGLDVVMYATGPLPQIRKLPDVTLVAPLIGPDNGVPTCRCARPIDASSFGVIVPPAGGSPIMHLVSGRLPDPSNPDEVDASYTLQQDSGVRLGSVIRVPFYSVAQASAYNGTPTSQLKPLGPTVAFRVVGFEATEFEFPTGGTPTYDLYATSAFARQVIPHVASSNVYAVRLRHGAHDLARFDAAADAAHLPGLEGYQNQDQPVAEVEAAIHPQAVGWWILAGLAALVGLAVIGQALTRQEIVESEDYPTLAALGTDRRKLVALGVARNLVVGLAGAAGALLVAVALSPLAPLGEARAAEASTGIAFDALVLPLGFVAIVAVVVVLGMWPAVRAARAAGPRDPLVTARPSTIVKHLAASGAPPSAVIGVGSTLDRRTGGAAVPVGSALLGTVLAVIALCGTAVFGASLTHLTGTPRLYGDTFQLNISNQNGNAPAPALLAQLRHDKAVTAVSAGIALPELEVDKVPVSAIAATAVRGQLLLAPVRGHVPEGTGQIALGSTSMRQAGAHVGSVVRVTFGLPTGGRRTLPFRVVGQVAFPDLSGIVGLGAGAAVTIAGYVAAICPTGPGHAACANEVLQSAAGGGLLVSVVGGPAGQAAIDRYVHELGSSVAFATTPLSLINFGEAVNFPLIFGAMLAVFGAATLLHLLVVSVTRRRREVSLLKVLGFVRGQVASSVAWQASTLALVGIIIGVPLGVVVGRAVWLAFAGNLGAVPVAVVPAGLLAVLAAGVLVVANLLAVGPALAAARPRPGPYLRAQ